MKLMPCSWLEHPLTKGMDLDDPGTTRLRRRILKQKTFLRMLYEDWYRAIIASLPDGRDPVLELGSGPGFLKELIPGLITSDVFECEGIDFVLKEERLPFGDGSLKAVVMTDVLHHLTKVRGFFSEAGRCVRDGGRVIAVEPWVTPWSRIVWSRLHHEPFVPDACQWELPGDGPLTGANSALPWIIFERDRELFERQFPMWRIQTVSLMMPFCYLLSGGISLRSFMPGFSFGFWRGVEHLLSPLNGMIAMFARIVLVKNSSGTFSVDTPGTCSLQGSRRQ